MRNSRLRRFVWCETILEKNRYHNSIPIREENLNDYAERKIACDEKIFHVLAEYERLFMEGAKYFRHSMQFLCNNTTNVCQGENRLSLQSFSKQRKMEVKNLNLLHFVESIEQWDSENLKRNNRNQFNI